MPNMKRGGRFLSPSPPECENEHCNYDDCQTCWVRKVIERLAAYEDTELTPHQINLIQAATLAQQDELAAYRATGLTPEHCAELAEAEREGRLVVTPRNPDIACTICGCVVNSPHRNRRLCDKCGSNVEKLRRHREKKKARKAALAAKEEA